MEIVLALIVLLVIAAAAFVYMRGRPGGAGNLRGDPQGPNLRGSRGARVASRHDPMAVAVERHAQATDPREAAVEEQNLQAQARIVAADLHARQAQQPDPMAAQVEDNRARMEADPYAQRELYSDPRDQYEPVNTNGRAYPGSDAADSRPGDADYPAQTRDPYAQPVDPDGVYPAQAPDPDAPPPRKRRFL